MAGRVGFLIAGVQKGGTTALYDYLCDHPDLEMSPVKEPHFFDDEAGVDWACPDYGPYEAQFSGDGRLKGEATPIYTYWPGALERTAPNWPDLVDASRLLRAISRIEARVADGDDGLIADLRLALGVGALAQNLAQRLIAGRVFGCFCGTFSSALTLAMQARRREELGSFPGPPPTGSACPASGQTPPDGAARSQPPAPSAV